MPDDLYGATQPGNEAVTGAADGEQNSPLQSEVSPGASPPAPQDLAAALREIEASAREWGIRPELVEGRFVSAMMAAIAGVGRITDAAKLEFRELFKQNQEAAASDLARAREITKAASIGLTQARNAQIFLQVEQENLVARMIQETLPLFIEKLQGALVLRERRWNDGVQRRRYAVVALVTLGLFLGGYVVRAWEDGSPADVLAQCLTHPLAAQGHLYCDVTSFARAVQ